MVIGVFILTTAITVQTVVREPTGNYDDAYKALGKATYIESGADKIVKRVEKKYTPQVVKEYGGWIAGILKVMSDQRISLEWKF